MTAVTLAACLLGAASLAGIAYLAITCFAVRGFLRGGAGSRLTGTEAWRPPVTILKPLHGADHDLAANLKRFCLQSYPTVQIVFGVREESDPAVPIVRQLMAELPDIDMALVCEAQLHGSNGKVSNLINMMAAARHELLVIADSDMSVGPDYLETLVAELTRPGVGLVTCLYLGRPTRGIWSRLGALFITYGFLPSVLVGRLVGSRDGCFGATMALTRSTLEAVGGFASLKDMLADDYELGAKVRALGLELVLSSALVETVVDEPSLRHLLAHELRWARTMRAIAPAGYAASIVTLPVPFALLAAACAPAVGLPCLLLALAARVTQIKVLSRLLRQEAPAAWLVPLRDLLSFCVLIASFCGTAVSWRDQRFRVDAEGRLNAERESRA